MQRARTKIDISIGDQRLTLTRDGEVLRSYPVSSSRFGIGTEEATLKRRRVTFASGKKSGTTADLGQISKQPSPLGPTVLYPRWRIPSPWAFFGSMVWT